MWNMTSYSEWTSLTPHFSPSPPSFSDMSENGGKLGIREHENLRVFTYVGGSRSSENENVRIRWWTVLFYFIFDPHWPVCTTCSTRAQWIDQPRKNTFQREECQLLGTNIIWISIVGDAHYLFYAIIPAFKLSDWRKPNEPHHIWSSGRD
jgi:hypothetical protein